MAQKSKKSGTVPKKPAAKKPARKPAAKQNPAIPQAAAAGIRESFSKASEAGLKHNALRREFLAFEKQAIETQSLYEREFNQRVEEAAKTLGIDPAKHTVNLQTLAFEPRK